MQCSVVEIPLILWLSTRSANQIQSDNNLVAAGLCQEDPGVLGKIKVPSGADSGLTVGGARVNKGSRRAPTSDFRPARLGSASVKYRRI